MIDASIPLQGINVSDAIAKGRAAGEQAVAARQQQQLQQYGVAQAKQDFEDQQNWKQALAASGGDFTKAIGIAAKTGLSAKMMQALQTGYLQQQQLKATLDKDQLANENTRREGLYSDLFSLHDIKDPGEFSKALDQKIQAGQKAGRIKSTDLDVLSQLNPGNFDSTVQTFLTPDSLAKVQTANAKRDDAVITGKNYALNVKKSDDEHANAIVTQNQAALQDANKTLVQALNTGGPLAYKKALEGLQGERADYVRGMMPSADVLAAKSPQDAIALINRGAMTAEQQTQADQAKVTSDRESQALAQKTKHDNALLALAQQTNAREADKYSKEFGGDAVKGWTEQIKQNPSAIEEVPANLRTAVSQEFSKQTGAPLPTKLGQADKTLVNTARYTQSIIQDIRQAAQTPEIQSILGPISGRLAKGESIAGTGLTRNQQAFVTNLEYLFLGEGKAVIGGRAPEKLMEGLKAVSGDPSKGLPQFLGSLDATDSVAQKRIETTIASQFGGRLPAYYKQQQSGGTASASPAPAAAKAPPVGYTEQGYKFKGGDPANQSNWEKVK